MADRRSIALLLGVVLLLVGVDQATKYVIQGSMVLGESREVLGDVIRLTYIRNPHGLFGVAWWAPGMALVWSCVAAVAIVLFYVLLPGGPTSVTRIGLALVAAGAVGNVLDRLRFGAVVDFIDVGIRSVRWPVFNVADSAVTVGVAVLLLHGLLRRPGVETPAPPS